MSDTKRADIERNRIMKQLQIYNPNTDEWFEVGKCYFTGKKGDKYLNGYGDGTEDKSLGDTNGDDSLDYPLTPIDIPIEWKLGKNVLASVSDEFRDRVTGEFRSGKTGDSHYDTKYHMAYDNYGETGDCPYIILSPPPAPSKTADELLADIVNAQDALYSSSGHDRRATALKAARNYLAKTEQDK